MTDWDVTPRAARRLRTFGRPVAPDELDAHTDLDTQAGDAGTDTRAGTSSRSSGHTSIWDRRKEHQPDPDAIDIGLETSHAWWAKRENLELLVNPKKRGAGARAKRAAEAAFAPPGTGPRSAPHGAAGPADRRQPPPSGSSTWDPANVYSWTTPPSEAAHGSDTTRATEGPTDTKTPWDVLGLTSDASWDEVTRRHKQLAKRHHPDRHGNADAGVRRSAETLMSEINAAFSDLRRIYHLTSGA
jgi:hypothetical protein